MKNTYILITFFIFPIICFASNDRYLCIADKATGFIAGKNRDYTPTHFNTENLRYIVEPAAKEDKKYKYIVKDLNSITAALCENDFGPQSILYCPGPLDDFRFNAITGRFLMANVNGYWNDENYIKFLRDTGVIGEIPAQDIVVMIGSCTKL